MWEKNCPGTDRQVDPARWSPGLGLQKQTDPQNGTSGTDRPSRWDIGDSHPAGLTKALALVGGTVHKDFGRDDIAERQEHLRELRVPELLGQVINKQVTAFGTWVTHKGQPDVSREAGDTPGGQRGAAGSPPQPLTFSLLLRDDGRLLGEGLADGRIGGGIRCWERETRG